METIYLVIAGVAFVLAACFAVAAVMVFFKMGVADAIRYMQNKPLKSSPHVRAAVPAGQKRGKPSGLKRHTGNPSKGGNDKKTSKQNVSAKADDATSSLQSVSGDSENPTELLGDFETSEKETQTLTFAESESPTGLLGQAEDSERQTDILRADTVPACVDFEIEISEQPTGVLDADEISEQPTRQLDAGDESEQPTGLLTPRENVESNSGFTFVIRQQRVETHTEETI